MNNPLQSYLAAHPAHHETTERWPVQGELRVRLCLVAASRPLLPPVDVTSSVLAIVIDAQGRVLFLWPDKPTGSIAHVLIGGRAEGGETPEETAVREVGEETGWRVELVRMIGFRHFHHLEPHRAESDRPYPDFIQPVFAARVAGFDAGLLVPGDRIAAVFVDFAEAVRMTDPAQRPLLQAALGVLHVS